MTNSSVRENTIRISFQSLFFFFFNIHQCFYSQRVVSEKYSENKPNTTLNHIYYWNRSLLWEFVYVKY